MWNFKTVTEAFETMYDKILEKGVDVQGTKAIYNQMFTILDTSKPIVETPWRKFSIKYAKEEWDWYLSGDRSGERMAKIANIWYNHMDERGYVNSNYGYQWMRNNQLKYVIDLLKKDRYTRQAFITIHDAKENDQYKFDTPCTLSIGFHFTPDSDKLNMTVIMRSNDLVYGFCNDAYCFIKLQQIVCESLNCKAGQYIHYAHNLHIYKRHFNMKNNYESNSN